MSFVYHQNILNDVPKTVNIVATIKMIRLDQSASQKSLKFDLQDIAQKCRNTQYNPKRFPAVFMRINDPKATGIIYSSGNITIVGARNTNECQVAAEKIINIIKKELNLQNKCKFENNHVQVRNIVATCKLGYPVCLDKINEDKYHSQYSVYDTFPGLIYSNQKEKKNKIIVLVFSSGKLVFTGAKNQEDIQKMYDQIKHQFQAFMKKAINSQNDILNDHSKKIC